MASSLVLSGGGSRGAYQAGAWKALHEAGVAPGHVVGVSAGAINGALIATGTPPDEIIDWWTSVKSRHVLRLRRDLWRLPQWDALHDVTPFQRMLEGALAVAQKPWRVPFSITAVDLLEGREVVWHDDEIDVPRLLASTALVPGLPPVMIDGRPYIDGGHWTPFPLGHALERRPDTVWGLLHAPFTPWREPLPKGLRRLVRRVTDIRVVGREAADVEAYRLRTRLPKKDPDHLPPFDLRVVAPDPPMTNDILRFEPARAREMAARGEADARRVLRD